MSLTDTRRRESVSIACKSLIIRVKISIQLLRNSAACKAAAMNKRNNPENRDHRG
jgi:hypothetical protein